MERQVLELATELSASSCLEELWREGVMVDVALRTDDGHAVSAHKLVLSAHSAFFRASFSDSWSGSQKDVVPIAGVSQAHLHALVECLYTGSIEISETSVAGLLAGASQLDFKPIVEACCKYLWNTLSVRSVCDVLRLADTHLCGDLFRQATTFWRRHAALFLSSPALLCMLRGLPSDILTHLLDQDLPDVTELERLQLILGWLEHDVPSRLPHLSQLLAHLRADDNLARICALAACPDIVLPTLASPTRDLASCSQRACAPARSESASIASGPSVLQSQCGGDRGGEIDAACNKLSLGTVNVLNMLLSWPSAGAFGRAAPSGDGDSPARHLRDSAEDDCDYLSMDDLALLLTKRHCQRQTDADVGGHAGNARSLFPCTNNNTHHDVHSAGNVSTICITPPRPAGWRSSLMWSKLAVVGSALSELQGIGYFGAAVLPARPTSNDTANDDRADYYMDTMSYESTRSWFSELSQSPVARVPTSFDAAGNALIATGSDGDARGRAFTPLLMGASGLWGNALGGGVLDGSRRSGLQLGGEAHGVSGNRVPVWRRSRAGTPRGVLVAAGRDESWRGLTATAIYDPLVGEWTPAPDLPSGMVFAQAAFVDGRAFLLGDGMCPLRWLDLERQAWRVAGAPALGRALHACAARGDDFHVIGGRTVPNQVEAGTMRYSTVDDRWHVSHRLCTARTAAAAAACGAHVYTSGGQDNVRVFDCAEYLDAERGWVPIFSRMHAARKYHAMASINKRLYCIGGKDYSGRRLSSVEAFDPREGRWQVVASLKTARSSCGVACLGASMYVMGGNSGDATLLADSEAYCPFMDSWQPSPPLPFACSGLAACPV